MTASPTLAAIGRQVAARLIEAGVRPPRAGMLIAWDNMDGDGAPNAMTIHEGRPVEAGVKYIATEWFRESDWI